jgi:hypothetical protein
MAKKALVGDAVDSLIGSFRAFDYFYPELCDRTVYLFAFLIGRSYPEEADHMSFFEGNQR